MSRSDWRIGMLAAALLVLATSTTASAKDQYELGRKATAAEIAGWNIDVRPDGAGLPPGQGSVAQGNDIYDAQCASCHGTFGESNSYLALTGIKDKLNDATTLFDYINRAMPFPHSKSLTADQVYAVSAYVLNLSDIVPADFVANKDSLPRVKMPNRDGLKPFPGLMSVDGKPDVHNVACMKNCEQDVKISGSLPPGFVDKLYGDIRDNFRGLAVMNESAPPVATAPAQPATAAELIQNYGCTACHAVDHKVVGPAFEQVAAKYEGDSGATAHLTQKIRAGGSGVWGSVPMPPQTDPSDLDLAAIVHWVLTLPPKK